MIQLVIEIPEEDYNNIEPFLNGETIKGGFNLFKALEIIKNGKPLPKGHWIPVSKQLPKTDGMYLVTTTGTHNDVVDIAYYYKDIGFHKASKVLAWMPLPEPYKEEGAD